MMKSDLFQSGSFLVVGVNDYPLCREGWYDRAIDGRFGILYRPMGKEASLNLFLPGGDLEIIALVSASITLCGGVLRGDFTANGNLLGNFNLDTETWTLQRFTFSNAPLGWMRFTWRIHNPFIPHETLKNGDFREMGLHVAAVRMERKIS